MQTRRFGRTGHHSSVLIYGAAALGEVSQQVADDSLNQALAAGINHFDTAASYGHAEQVMGPFVAAHRSEIFLATKSEERRAEAAWAQINRSLELLNTDQVDLLQVHAVNDQHELDQVFAPGGAIEAFQRAKDEGLTRFVGITGHTEAAPSVHTEGLRRFDFDSVLCPMNHQLNSGSQYHDDFGLLLELIGERDLGLRTIKAIARRPWDEQERRYATWYEPFDDPELIRAAISWVLGSYPQITGIATAGETTLLNLAIAAVADPMPVDQADQLLSAVEDYRSIFV